MDAEMHDHLEREIAERMRHGATHEEATRVALRDFGGVERFKEEARDVLGLRVLDDTSRDFRFAVRVLRRSPGFTTAVVLTFAIGIGCTAAIFTLVNGILLRPLPYPRPSELVALWERNIPRAQDRNVVSVALFENWRDHTRSFSAIAAMVPAPLTVSGSTAERLTGAQVSASYFHVLGVQPAIGRDFTNADEVNGGAAVTILSDAFWRARYGADRAVVGRSIVMDGRPYTIIGVMPKDFEPPSFGWMTEHPLWIPFAATADNRNWGRFLHVIGRLRPGVAIGVARAELAALSERLARENTANKEWSSNVVPLDVQITGDVQRPLLTLFAAVVLLLLMAIVNVANLVTSFARRRQSELALRSAIGATRWRLLRQQLALSAVLGAVATAVGIAIAVAASRGLVALMPPDVPRLAGAHLDRNVLAFVAAIASLTTLAAGWSSAMTGLPRLEASINVMMSRATTRLRGARLVTAEIAIGLILSVLATLMVRSFVKLGAVDLGFRPEHVAVARISLPGQKYPTDIAQRQFFDALLERARALPGVTSASVATTSPFACCAPSTNARDADRLDDATAPSPTTDVRYVDSEYFATLRISVLDGAVFRPHEPSAGAPRVVVSRALARALWGDANPIGRKVALTLYGTTTAEVIGIVGDVHRGDARTPPRPAAYLSTNRFPSSERDLIVRSGGEASTLIPQLRETLATLDRAVPLYRATTLEHTVDQALAQEQFVTTLLGAFAIVALLLAAVGVHGVLSADLARRRKEIGIRVALGADRTSVYALVMRRILEPALYGVAIGVTGALILSRAMASLVFGIATWDPASFTIVIALLLFVATAATWRAAFAASRVSPLEAIKSD